MVGGLSLDHSKQSVVAVLNGSIDFSAYLISRVGTLMQSLFEDTYNLPFDVVLSDELDICVIDLVTFVEVRADCFK